MLNLFDNYNSKTIDLEKSLKKAGYLQPTVILNDDGFLPEHVMSPVSFFTEMYTKGSNDVKKPKFFNEIKIPNYWEIKGDGQKADIYEGYMKRGHINYSDQGTDYRVVKSVEWFNDAGKVRQIDLYNKYGQLFGKKTFSDGILSLTTYFDEFMNEKILINHVANTVQVSFKKRNYIFSSFVNFVIFYLKVAKLNANHIFYNSLARPFLIISKLEQQQDKRSAGHVLFWQEESKEMPGNMQAIFENKAALTKKIIVQNQNEYQRLKQQIKVDPQEKLSYLGFIYDFVLQPKLKKNIFILTNSDSILHLKEIAEALPKWQINIAARTTMSTRLMNYEKYENISLYPLVTVEKTEKLIKENAFYLDINEGSEVENIIRNELDHNKLILSFERTAHNKAFVNKQNIISAESHTKLIQLLNQYSNSNQAYKKAVAEQQIAAGNATIQDYKEVLK